MLSSPVTNQQRTILQTSTTNMRSCIRNTYNMRVMPDHAAVVLVLKKLLSSVHAIETINTPRRKHSCYLRRINRHMYQSPAWPHAWQTVLPDNRSKRQR